MNVALCKCGVDMTEHSVSGLSDDEHEGEGVLNGHLFDAAGTKYHCQEAVLTRDGVFLCPRPAYHHVHHVSCGPLTGDKLW